MAVTSPNINDDRCLLVSQVIERGYVGEVGKNRRQITGAVSKEEAEILASIIFENGCLKSLETGVANGISTLAITEAIALNGGHHYGVDPCQLNEHQGVALSLLEEYKLRSSFTLLDGPAHLEIPKLIEAEEKFDLVFIDGMHKFDYKFLDFFLADQVLKVDGFLVFHDILLPSTKKIYRYIKRSHDYRFCKTHYRAPSLYRQIRYVVGAFLKARPFWYTWHNNFRNLLVLQKKSDVEHPWNYFRDF